MDCSIISANGFDLLVFTGPVELCALCELLYSSQGAGGTLSPKANNVADNTRYDPFYSS